MSLILLSGCGKTEISRNSSRMPTTSESSSGKAETDNENTAVSDNGSSEQAVESGHGSSVDKTTAAAGTVPDTTTPAEEGSSSEQADPSGSIDKVIADINEIFFSVRNTGAKYSVKMISLYDSKTLEAGNCYTQMVSASLIKLYVAGAVYERYDSVKSYEAYSGETDHLLDIMISQSDNDACNTLVTRLGGGDPAAGMTAVNDFCLAHGYNNTEMNRLMLDFNGLENYTTVSDCCQILKSYYQNELAGSESVIGFMKNQVTRTKIPAGITDGTLVANKTGELANVENDAAIIYADTGVYILCIMTNDLSDTETARNAIAQTSAVVYNSMAIDNITKES